MNNNNIVGALKSLLGSKRRADVFSLLDRLYTINGGNAVTWRPVGDRDGNFATIHLTANPEVSLIERVTNSIDATFERLAEESPQLKKIRSPHKVTMQTYFS